MAVFHCRSLARDGERSFGGRFGLEIPVRAAVFLLSDMPFHRDVGRDRIRQVALLAALLALDRVVLTRETVADLLFGFLFGFVARLFPRGSKVFDKRGRPPPERAGAGLARP